MAARAEPQTRAFSVDDYIGEVSMALAKLAIEPALGVMVKPAATSETLHWGRNYLYSATLETEGATVEAVVKQFRNQGLKGRLERRLKGSKAERSWRVAWAMRAARIPTPAPLFLIESVAPDGPSFFVSERLPRFLEARYFFRALEAGTEADQYPELDADRLIEKIGRSIRRLHDAGIWHRDLSIGNLLLVDRGGAGEPPEVFFIDLNRARLRRGLNSWQRTRDLCRLRVFRRQQQELLLVTYWGSDATVLWRRRLLYQICFRGFLAKVWLKDAVRKPFRRLRELVAPRHPHVHIPQAPDDATARNRAVWDGLSDQPHQHATRFERLAIRVVDAPLHARELGSGLAALPAVRRRYRQLEAELYSEPIAWGGMGIALRPWSSDPEAQVEALEELGTRRILLRLHPWQQEHRQEEELAAELHRRGFELAFALPQNRDLVLDLSRWRAAVTELGERFGRFGRHFQIGQAVNRSKWGIWNYREYLDLVAAASEILRRQPNTEILGPAVIDYEPLRTAAMVNMSHAGVHFDVLASLLYVDRRGAPENRQLGFDTVDKILQLKAIADTAQHCGNRSWITEINWPLWEGPHSPAGRKVSVDEESQASYLVRYFLLALGTGAVERVYWWQLIARGYGLCFEDGEHHLVRRPGFAAYSTLCRTLEGATFVGPRETRSTVRAYRFRAPDGVEIVVAWTVDNTVLEVELGRPIERASSRDGQELPRASPRVEIDGAPRYFWLQAE